jgi:hypothetical protein
MWSLKALTDLAWTASYDKAFHGAVTLLVKKCNLSSPTVSCWAFKRRSCPRRRLYIELVVQSRGRCGTKNLTFSKLCVILYCSIRSPRTLLSSSFVNPRRVRRSSGFKSFMAAMVLVARCWTFSRVSISPLKWGDQAWIAYSRCGRIYARYSVLQRRRLRLRNAFFSRPNALFAIEAAASTWAFSFRSLEVSTPRSRSSVVSARSCELPSVFFIW